MPAVEIGMQSPAKLNLTFDIKGLLADGYHEVETLLQAINLQDRLIFKVELDEPFSVSISCSGIKPEQFPLGDDNIIYRAANAFRECMSQKPVLGQWVRGKSTEGQDLPSFKVEVVVEKNIPVGAGLGGSSSNAAATLIALNRVFEEPFTMIDLMKIGSSLGADVPFFLIGGSCVGTGRGDDLKSIARLPTLWFVLIKPKNICVSSKWAYAAFDDYIAKYGKQGLPTPNWQPLVHMLQDSGYGTDGSLKKLSKYLGNVFEPVIFDNFSEMVCLHEAMEAAGALCCRMTGSGSSLYGLADTKEHAHYIVDQLLLKQSSPVNEPMPDIDIFVAESVRHGVLLEN